MMQWSVMRYDLKTALDVLGLPCHVQVADDQLVADDIAPHLKDQHFVTVTDRRQNCSRVIQLDKKVCTCHVRARVLDVDDVEWFILKKGIEYYKQRSRFLNKEILISLDCSSKVRLRDKGAGKLYTTIREVAADFPRFVKAEQDTVCVSPGSTACQIVTKGSVLELDRITQDSRSVRGFRETFLICKDPKTGKELAFRLMSTCRFSKLLDISSYYLKDLIERLPLPQVVDVLVTNPYDVISASDTDAADLLMILSGPLELLGLKMQEFVVGNVVGEDYIIGFPCLEDYLEVVLVNIPVSSSGSVRDVYNNTFHTIDYEDIMDKLYLLYADEPSGVVLRGDYSSVLEYDMLEEPEPPPVPNRKLGVSRNLTFSEADDTESRRHGSGGIQRKRFSSTSDVEKKRASQKLQRHEMQSRSFKNYLNQFSRKVKTTASQFFLGLDGSQTVRETPANMTPLQKSTLTRSNPTLTENSENDRTCGETGFICYIQFDAEREERPSSDSVLSGPTFRQALSDSFVFSSMRTEHVLSTTTECFQNASNQVRECCSSVSDYVVGKIATDQEDYVYSRVDKVKSRAGSDVGCINYLPSPRPCKDRNDQGNTFTGLPSGEYEDIDTPTIESVQEKSKANSTYNTNPSKAYDDFDNRPENRLSENRTAKTEAVKAGFVPMVETESDACIYATVVGRGKIPSFHSDRTNGGSCYSQNEVIYATVRRDKGRFKRGGCCEICKTVLAKHTVCT